MIIALESLVKNSGHVKLAGVYDNRWLGLENLQSEIEEFERARTGEMLCALSLSFLLPLDFTHKTFQQALLKFRRSGHRFAHRFQ